MIGEVDISGVFVPPALLLAIVAFVATVVIRGVLRRLNAYRFIWHAGLFDTALFVVVFFVIALATVGTMPYMRGLD